MKNFKFTALFLLATIIGISSFQSCSKDNNVDTTEDLLVSNEGQAFKIDNASFDNGRMVFHENCQIGSTATAIEKNEFKELPIWEDKFGFKSLKSKLEAELIKLNNEKPDIYDKEYFSIDPETGVYVIDFPFYFLSQVLNENAEAKAEHRIVKFTRGNVYFVDEESYGNIGDITSFVTSDEKQGVFVSPVKFSAVSTDHLLASGEFTKPNENEEKTLGCQSNPPEGTNGSLQGSCKKIALGNRTDVKAYITSWRCPAGEGFFYCGRLWATVTNTYHGTNPNGPSTPVLNSTAQVEGNYVLHYHIGSILSNSNNFSGDFNLQSTTPNYHHIFTIFDISSQANANQICIDNTYSGNSWGLQSWALSSSGTTITISNHDPSHIQGTGSFPMGSSPTLRLSCEFDF